jgi:ABC-type amino acid transport system permease subunit
MDVDFSPIIENWRFFASGLGVTVLLSVISAVTSILAGLVIALLRLYGPRWLSTAAGFLRRHHARHPHPGGAGVDLLRLPAAGRA